MDWEFNWFPSHSFWDPHPTAPTLHIIQIFCIAIPIQVLIQVSPQKEDSSDRKKTGENRRHTQKQLFEVQDALTRHFLEELDSTNILYVLFSAVKILFFSFTVFLPSLELANEIPLYRVVLPWVKFRLHMPQENSPKGARVGDLAI